MNHRVYRAEGIDAAVFVMYAVDDEFSHVANVREMETLPNRKRDAKECRDGFYRSDTVERRWATPEEQQRDREYMRGRVRQLAAEWRDHVTPGEFRDLNAVTPDRVTPDPGADS